MPFLYHVTAQKPTAVIASCTGNFSGPDDLNLIIAKNTYIEINEVTPEGLKILKEIPIFGRIAAIKLFTRKGKNTSALFVITHKADAAVIEASRDENGSLEFVTIASGCLEETHAHIIEKGFAVLLDPSENYLLIRFYKGLLKIIPLDSLRANNEEDKEQILSARVLSIEQRDVIDMTFLYGRSEPTLAFIYEDGYGVTMKTFGLTLHFNQPTLTPVVWRGGPIEPDASLLIPVPEPYKGVIVIGMEAVTYYDTKGGTISQLLPVTKKSIINCCGVVDANRYLLGDMSGCLFMLHLRSTTSGDGHSQPAQSPSGGPGGMQIEVLGEVTIPETITYLDNGVLFIGSLLGDSQLVRLASQLMEDQLVSPMESFLNVGPVMDMAVMETQGQRQLITASGAFKCGSLRVIRNGIGIQEHASIDQEMIKAVWCFSFNSSEFDDTIVLSLVGHTKVLRLNQDDIEPIDLNGLEDNLQTYHCALLSPGLLLQVTNKSLRLISVPNPGSGLPGTGLLQEWTPANDKAVSHCSSHGNQIVGASGALLHYLILKGGRMEEVSCVTLSNEVACLDMTPFSSVESPSVIESRMVAVGLWMELSVLLLTLPDLKEVHRRPVDTSTLPRSLLITQFLHMQPHLLVGLGDGTLVYYTINTKEGGLEDEKRITVGTGPMSLRCWTSPGSNKTSVFVCSDHPCVIFASNQKLVFANVNLKEVTFMHPLNSQYYTSCLALVSPSCLTFGSVDEIQKLHVRTIPLEETPKRLVCQDAILALTTYRTECMEDGVFKPLRQSISVLNKAPKSKSGPPKIITGGPGVAPPKESREVEVSSLLILDNTTFEVLHAHTFAYSPTYSEYVVSLTACKLEGISGAPGLSNVLVLGTAILQGDEDPRSGRITIFRWTEDHQLDRVVDHQLSGVPYSMVDLNGKLVIAVTSFVYLFEVTSSGLREVASYCDSIINIFVKRKGDFILVGDVMRSLFLLAFSSRTNKFELIGKHIKPKWVTAMEIIDDDHFIASEGNRNLYVVTKDNEPTSGTSKYETPGLVECAGFHLGEYLNTFLHGSLGMQSSTDASLPVSVPLLYGSVSGAIGMVCQISGGLYHLIKEVESRVASLLQAIGGFKHSSWRALVDEMGSREAQNFVDGDLVEMFLDLSPDDKVKVVDGLKIFTDLNCRTLSADDTQPCSVDELTKIIEDLTRIH